MHDSGLDANAERVSGVVDAGRAACADEGKEEMFEDAAAAVADRPAGGVSGAGEEGDVAGPGGSVGRGVWRALNEAERALVAANVGLVGVHLRHHVPTPRQPTRDREQDDLFQEGVLALMRAAQSWREAEHGPFASYALPRIRAAVHTALHEYFATVRTPTRVARESRKKHQEVSVQAVELSPAAMLALPGPGISVEEGAETLRHAVRARFEGAVEAGLGQLRRRVWRQRNPVAIMERLAGERLLIGREQGRTALRQIARDFGISSGRAAAYEKQLVATVKACMAADRPLALLVRMAESDPRGYDGLLDAQRRRALWLEELSAFEDRFAEMQRADQAEVVYAMIERSCMDPGEVVRNLYRLIARDPAAGELAVA